MLHVLAHVDVGRIAPSCHEPSWIAWAAERLGPASERALGEDARVLADALGSHERLAAAHALVWTWKDETSLRAASARDLADLGEEDVADVRALTIARGAGPAVEVLRAAAELELPLLASLEPHSMARGGGAWQLEEALGQVLPAAPELARVSVAMARPLPRRGRAFARSILVGAPGVAGAKADLAAWQAAHEATVLEVDASPRWLGTAPHTFEAIERTALGLLRSRARRAGLSDAHGRWLLTQDLGALGPIADVDDGPE